MGNVPSEFYSWLPTKSIRNILAAYGANAANLVVPWIYVPYLLRIIGPDRYGRIAFAAAIVQYAVVLTDYGYNLIGSREISKRVRDPIRFSRYVSEVMWTRAFLLVFGLLILFVSTLVVPKLYGQRVIILLTYGNVAANVLFPVFVFYGIEKMNLYSSLLLSSRISSAVLIFMFVRVEEHYVYVPLILCIPLIIVGLLALFIILPMSGIRLGFVSLENIKGQLTSGFRVFISNVATSLFTTSNIMILGFLGTDKQVGFFSIGEKLVRSLQNLVTPIYKSLQPHVFGLASESVREAYEFLRRSLLLTVPPMMIISVILFIGAESVVSVVFGSGFAESVLVLHILAPVPLIFGFTVIYSNTFLLGFGWERYWTLSMLLAGGGSLLLSLILVGVFQFGYIGSSISLLFGEIVVVSRAYVRFRRYGREILVAQS